MPSSKACAGNSTCRGSRWRSSRMARSCWNAAMACASSARRTGGRAHAVRDRIQYQGVHFGLAVDAGRRGQAQPRRSRDRHLPWFQMSDAYVTREMRVRDLLAHRSGLSLGAGDLLYWPTTDLQAPRKSRGACGTCRSPATSAASTPTTTSCSAWRSWWSRRPAGMSYDLPAHPDLPAAGHGSNPLQQRPPASQATTLRPVTQRPISRSCSLRRE